MNILIAPDKFKGSLTAKEVCAAIAEGVWRHDPHHHIKQIPLADGGEGTLDVLDQYLDLETVPVQVCDPLFRPIQASYKRSGTTAYIEMAQASGLDLLAPDERDCLLTTSLGTGQLIYDGYQKGVRTFYVFVGGSATNDAGWGVLQALGIVGMDKETALKPTGENLARLNQWDTSGLFVDRDEMVFHMVCDVRNPLFGPMGAAQVYAPQKGADPAAVQVLEKGLKNFAAVMQQETGRIIHQFPGSGAAGGVAAGISGFFPTQIQSGISTIMELVGLPTAVAEADLVITGEGKMDHQTLAGKVIAGVHELCHNAGKDLGVICGSLDLTPTEVTHMGFWKVLPLMREGTSLDEAMQQAAQLVSDRTHEMMQT